MNSHYHFAIQEYGYGENPYGANTYSQSTTQTTTPNTETRMIGGPLANTGYDVIIVVAFAAALIAASVIWLIKRLRSRSK